jgi:ATP-dependent protease HslVU (ClpYQ) peptidase subunit
MPPDRQVVTTEFPREMKPPVRVAAYINIIVRHIEDGRIVPIVKRTSEALTYGSKPKIARSALVLALCCTLRATTIVAVYTPNDVAVAADSLGTFGDHTEQVCKIFQMGDVFLGVAGVDNDPITNFNVADVVFRSTGFVRNFSDKIKSANSAILVTLREEAVSLRIKRPEEFARVIDPNDGGVGIILIGVQDGQTFAISQYFTVAVNSHNNIVVIPGNITQCPGSPGCQGFTFYGGKSQHLRVSPFFRAPIIDTADRARALVQVEIDAHTPGVGQPIDVLRVTTTKQEWIKQKRGCPINLAAVPPPTKSKTANKVR